MYTILGVVCTCVIGICFVGCAVSTGIQISLTLPPSTGWGAKHYRRQIHQRLPKPKRHGRFLLPSVQEFSWTRNDLGQVFRGVPIPNGDGSIGKVSGILSGMVEAQRLVF